MRLPVFCVLHYTPTRGRRAGRRHKMFCETRGCAEYWARRVAQAPWRAQRVVVVTYSWTSTERYLAPKRRGGK